MKENEIIDELAFIKKVIEDSRRSFCDNGMGYIVWGVLVFLGLMSEYIFFIFKLNIPYFYFWMILARDIKKAASRLREIEETVDEATGEWYLLRYERLWGGAVRGYAGRSRCAPAPPKPQE